MVKERILTAFEVRRLPCGSKVVRRTKYRDEVMEVVMVGRHKKLFRHDKWNGPMYWRPISEDDTYLEVRRK